MANRFILTAQLRLAAPTNIQSVVNQINRGLRGVRVNVTINTHQVGSQLASINKSLLSTSKAARAASNDIERFGEQAALTIRRYGAFTLATTAFIKLTHAIQSGVNDAIKFDREMVRIAQVTGHSLSGLKDLNQEVTRLAKTYGVASSEILEAGVTLAQAGQSAKQVKTILESIAKTGVSATFGNMKNTTEAVIAAMQQFNLKAEDMEETLSSINAVSAKFAVESSDITTAIIRTGGAFEAAGGNIKEFQALFTSVRQTTRESAETIATGFRTIFTRLQRSRTQNFLQSLGIDLKDVEGQFVGPYEAIRRLSTALKELRSTDPRFAQIIEELGGFRQISKVIPLITKFDVAQQALNVSLRSGNSLTEDADVAQQALAVQISKVREEFLALVRNIANNAAFKGILDLTLKLTSSLISLADALQPIIPLLAAVGAAKIGSGLGSFARGFGNKISGHANGGFVHAFATGGLVPGHGSGDTVPARLTPGEFVVRKNAVQAIGVDNLHKINKYAFGGVVEAAVPQGTKKFIIKDTNGQERYVTKKDVVKIMGYSGSDLDTQKILSFANSRTQPEKLDLYNKLFAKKDLLGDVVQPKVKRFGPDNSNAKGKVDLGKVISIVTPDPKYIGEVSPIQITGTLNQIGKASSSSVEGSNKVIEAFAAAQYGSASPENVAKARATEISAHTSVFGLKKGIGDSFNKNAVAGVVGVINKIIKDTPEFQTVTNIPPKTLVDLRDVVSKSAQNSVRGVLFEGIIRQAIGAKIPRGADAVVDFNNTTGFDKIFHDGASIGDKAEAKSSLNLKNARSTVLKTLKDMYGIKSEPRKKNKDAKGQKYIEFHALGGFAGGHGTDTVPAMLTPGEFVINKSAASKLGSTTLNRLNNADKVQHFASGGPVGNNSGLGAIAFNPLTIGLVFSSLQQFGKMISGGNKDLDKFLGATTSLAFEFGVFKSVIDGAKSSFGGALHRIPGNDSRSLADVRSGIAESRRPRLEAHLNRIDDVASQYNINPDVVNRYKNEVIARHDARVDRAAGIKFNSLGNRIGRVTAAGGAVAGAIGNVAGDHVSSLGKAKIANGEDGTALSAAGGALAGAGTGAAIGAAFGPWGVAIGAAAGAAYGFTTSLKEAQKELENVQIAKKLEEFATVLDRYASGRLSANDARGGIEGGTIDAAHRFLSSTGEDKQKAKADFAPHAQNVEKFIIDITKSADSFEELQRSSGLLLSDFALLTGLPYKDLKDQLTKQIAAQKKAAAFLKDSDKLHNAQVKATRDLVAMSAAINKVSTSFRTFDVSMTNAGRFIEGGHGTSNIINASDVFENAGKGNITDTTELSKLADGITKSFGEAGKEQTNKLAENTRLLAALPSLLLEAKAGTGFGDSEGIFEKVLAKLIKGKGFSDESIAHVTGGVRHVIGAESKDEKIIDDIRNNLESTVHEVGKSLQGVISSFKEFAPVFKEQGERIKAAFESYVAAQIRVSDFEQTQLKNTQHLTTFIANATNQVRGNGAVRADQLARVGKLTGGVTDPQAIASMLARAQAESNRLGKAASSTTDTSEQEKFLSLQADENVKIAKANKALHELADNSETLAEIQKELAEVEERRKEREGIVRNAVFGSREDKLQQSRALAITAHAQRFGIDAVPEHLRRIVEQTLEGRGKEGRKELERLAAGSQFGKAIGGGAVHEAFQQGGDPKANALLKAADQYTQASNAAIEALKQNADNLGQNVKSAISEQNKDFLTKLEAIFKQNLVNDKETKLGQLKDDRTGLQKNIGNQILLKRNFGIDQDNKASADGAVKELQKLSKIRAERDDLAKKPDFEDKANSLRGEALRHGTQDFATQHGFTLDKDFTTKFDAAKTDDEQRAVARKAILAARGEKAASLNTQYEQSYRSLGKNFGATGIALRDKFAKQPLDEMNKGLERLSKDLKETGNESIEQLREKLKKLQETIDAVTVERDKIKDSIPVTKATGGSIPGVGNTDTVHAILTPGEFVLRKSAVEAIGVDNLYAMNNGYAIGGLAGDDLKRRKLQNEFAETAAAVDLHRRARESAARTLSPESQRKNLEAEVRRIDVATGQQEISRARFKSQNAANAVDKKFSLTPQFNLSNNALGELDRQDELKSNAAILRKKYGFKTKAEIQAQKEEEAKNPHVNALNNILIEIDNKKARGNALKQKLINKFSGPKAKPKSNYDKLVEEKLARISRASDFDAALKNEGLFKSSKTGNYELATRGHLIESREAERRSKVKERRALQTKNGFNGGGHVGGGSASIHGVEELRGVVERFSTVVNGLAEKMSQFKDMSISLQATHKVEVTFNGAEVFSKLQPEFQKMAVEESKKAINNMLDTKFPDVGRIK